MIAAFFRYISNRIKKYLGFILLAFPIYVCALLLTCKGAIDIFSKDLPNQVNEILVELTLVGIGILLMVLLVVFFLIYKNQPLRTKNQ